MDHVTAYRWVQHFRPLPLDTARAGWHSVGDRWLVDETYVTPADAWGTCPGPGTSTTK